jgi:hypothetical protein
MSRVGQAFLKNENPAGGDRPVASGGLVPWTKSVVKWAEIVAQYG